VNKYLVGSVVTVAVVFVSIGSNDPVDPSTVTALIKHPTGAVDTYVYGVDEELVRDSVGRYHVDVTIPINESSIWYYRFEGTGTNAAPGEASFEALPSNFA
jgi:hypothetical protein